MRKRERKNRGGERERKRGKKKREKKESVLPKGTARAKTLSGF